MKSCVCLFSGDLLCAGSLAYMLSAPGAPAEHNLQVRIVPQYQSVELELDAMRMADAAGQKFSVTRLDFFVSNFALRNANGRWVEQADSAAYVSARSGRTGFLVTGIPSGHYDRVRFFVGLTPEINHRDPANYPAGHALHPNVNGLHWSWMGGYVFLALEGNWIQPDGKIGGYSYHLATDRELMTVELPVELQVNGDTELSLSLNLDQVFTGKTQIALAAETLSTHSRTNDLFADQLRRNITAAFAIQGERLLAQPASETLSKEEPGGIREASETRRGLGNRAAQAPEPPGSSLLKNAAIGETARAGNRAGSIEIGPNATPYPLSFPAYFPKPDLPRDNPLTQQGVELGKRLFFDTRLSRNNSQSCASCHQPGAAFTDGKMVAVGTEGKTGKRNSMPLLNLAWKSAFFWDGRAASLREQVLQPIQNPIEMDESLTNLVSKLQADADYRALFNKAFGHSGVTSDRIARALEQFLLTQVACDSKFDRVLRGEANFSVEEQRGFGLFHTEYDPRHEQFGADCFHCHGGPLFQSQNFANNGLDSEFGDSGRVLVTGREGDKGRFAVASLRNVEVTWPYMHDGRFKTLEEVVGHYCTGMKRSASLDPNLAKHPNGGVPLNEEDKKALVAFLKTLTDEKYKPSAGELAMSDSTVQE